MLDGIYESTSMDDVEFGGTEPVDEPSVHLYEGLVLWSLVAQDARHESDRQAYYYELDRNEKRRRAIRKEFLRREIQRRSPGTSDTSLTLTEALSALEGVRKKGGYKWQAKCPVHEDKIASLVVFEHSDKPDRPVFFCSAGCSWQEIKAALQTRR